MNAHHFFFAVNTKTNQAECFATKYLPVTNYTGSRFKFWRINSGLEQIEKAKVVSWNHDVNGQDEQLQAALGDEWKVVSFWTTCKILENYFSPTTRQPK